MTEILQMREVAMKGDPEDMYMFGHALMYGEYELWNGEIHKCRKNFPEALKWIEKSAKAGCVGAMMELGEYYYCKRPRTRENLLRALHWDEQAATIGDADTFGNLAMTYALLGETRKAHELMVEVLKIGNDPKAWRYGYALFYGNCEDWIGENVKFTRDEEEGLRIIERSARNGNSDAMIGLGICYSNASNGRTPDYDKALYWDIRAWRKGNVLAAQNAAVACMHLNQPSECIAWLKRGYRKCRWPVALSLAKACISGYGTKRDIDKAKEILHWISESEESHPSTRPQARRYLKALEAGEIPKLKQPI